MKELLSFFTSFSNKERNGVIVLCAIFVLIIIAKQFAFLVKNDEKIDYAKFDKEIAEFRANLQKKDEAYENRLDKFIAARYDTLTLFKFDPNNTTPEQWKQLGMTEKQIKTISNYIAHGGKFFDKEDFRKIYGIRNKQYQILKPYIRIPKQYETKYENEKTEDKWSKDKIQELFEFNPNNTKDEDWRKLGLTGKQIQTITNYLASGGKFYDKEDVKKIYGIGEEQYNILAPYINIPTRTKQPEEIRHTIDINSASVDDLKQLKGIGNTFAKRIIKFRNLLGGYAFKEQLKDVYGLENDTYTAIEEYIYIDKEKVEKLSINFSNTKELASHIYISYQQAKKIVDYRTKNGSYRSIEQLLEYDILPKNEFDKVKYYLKTN